MDDGCDCQDCRRARGLLETDKYVWSVCALGNTVRTDKPFEQAPNYEGGRSSHSCFTEDGKHKRGYRRRRDAKKALKHMQTQRRQPGMHLCVYHCDRDEGCGLYHIGTEY